MWRPGLSNHLRRSLPVLLITLCLGACGDDSSLKTEPSPIPAFRHESHGCALRAAPLDTCRSGAHVLAVAHVADSLRLTVQFESNCCPGFRSHAESFDNHLAITVVDTLNACRCLCPYVDDFIVPWAESGPINLSFRAESGGATCVSGIDTVLVLP